MLTSDSRLSPSPVSETSDLPIAVIGSGFGGLAAAIRLQVAAANSGRQVNLFEQRDQAGGRAYVYRDQGFTFDAGPTVITAPECLEELFELAGRRMSDYVELLPVMPFYRLFWEDGSSFDYSNDPGETERQIRLRRPEDVEGYRRFLRYSEEVFNEGYTKLVHVPFLDWRSMVKCSPQLMRLGAWRSVYDTVSRYIGDEQLRQAFSFHSLLVGGNPYATSSIYTLIHFLERQWGVWFPRGGTGALVQALVKLFCDLGGRLHLNAGIDQIVTEGTQIKGIKLLDGSFFATDTVVSNADVMHTYRDLLKAAPSAQATVRKLDRMNWSMSLFLIYFGTDRRYQELAHHNVLFGPRYKPLLDDIFRHGNLPDDFSLYLHAPTVSDPALAPEGCEAFYVLAPVAHMGLLDVDWEQMGPVYADKILDYMQARYLPDLRKHLVTQRIFTPQDFKTELHAHHGSAFSLEPRLTQSAYFRTHNRDKHLPGLYFVGAGTHPGAGVPGVINSAKA
ncbi:MAG: phytoene desaturase, partial [Candidatus Melainabacteria bacterium HGW-Melainabacteria-1]